MNESDSEKISGILEQMGYIYADEPQEADVLLINTCSVRETAENKVYGLLGRLKKIKENNPALIIGVGGCMTQIEETALHIKKRFPYVNIIFGTNALQQLPELIKEASAGKKTLINRSLPEGIHEGIISKRQSNLKAWVPIMYGCNNFCTYCIVPYVRGRERSRKPEDIISEITGLAGQGFKEVTLLGQNVNSYGKDLDTGFGFADLLLAADRVDGLARIRFMTSHPKDFSDRLIEAITKADKVCRHFHIPIQSGSDIILKAMNRGYSRDYYLSVIKKIKKVFPGAAITTDIMVGFPGETKDDFLDTMSVVEDVRYDAAYTFIYNRRRGTPADRMADQVPDDEKTRRISILIKRQNEITLAKNKSEAGKIHHVLVEGLTKNDSAMVNGRTDTNKMVILPGTEDDIGKIIKVKILKGTLAYLAGERQE